MIRTLFFLFVGASYFSTAQNLVPNGSFEQNSILPDAASQWDYCIGWNNVNLQTGTSPGSPDYFHLGGTGTFSLPSNYYAYVHPLDGEAIFGFMAKGGTQERNEYISTELNESLQIGYQYKCSFWLTNGEDSLIYNSRCNGLGFQLSTDPLTQTFDETISILQPEFVIDSVVNSNEWIKFEFDFVAQENYKYITLGGFYSFGQMTSIQVDNAPSYIAYYFIDNVELICTDLRCSGNYELQMPNVFTPNADQINDVFGPIEMVHYENYHLEIRNRWGKLIFETTNPQIYWDGTFNEEDCTEGVYFWQVSYSDQLKESHIEHGFFHLER